MMRPQSETTFGGRYNARPNPYRADVIKSSNIGRSRITESYHGYDGPLDSDKIGEKQHEMPRTRRIADEASDIEVSKSGLVRQVYMPKTYQSISTYLDLSNVNSHFDENSKTYIFNINNSRYYSNNFGKSGLEKIYSITFSPISVPAYFTTMGYDLSRLFLSMNLTESYGNEGFNYNVSFFPDNNASSATRKVLMPAIPTFELNGYCPLETIKVQLRDVSNTINIADTNTGMFEITAIGLVTTLDLVKHGLQPGMQVYIEQCNSKKSLMPAIYTIAVLNDDQVTINFDSTNMDYLIGQKISFVIDDLVFNLNIKMSSIRNDI